MEKFKQRIFPFIILCLIFAYTYSLFEGMPYLGFYYSYLDEITDIFVPEAEPIKGGMLRGVNGEDWTALRNDVFRPGFPDLAPGDSVRLTIEKDNRIFDINWKLPLDNSAEWAARLRSTWWLPLVFWLSGTLIWFNIRPRNKTWRLLVAFNWIIALYLAGLNGPSLGNRMLSVPVIRFLGCMVLPVFLQLHWEFPSPLQPMSGKFVSAIYAISTLIGVLTAVNLLPPGVFISMSVLAVIGSFSLMIYKRFAQPEIIRDNRFVLYTFALIFLPPLVTTIGYTFLDAQVEYFGFTSAYMAMPALPAVYFLIAFQKQMYALRNQRRVRLLFIGIVLICSATISALLLLLGKEDLILDAGTIVLFISAVLTLSVSIILIPLLGLLKMNPVMTSDRMFFTSDLQPRSNRLITPYFFLVAFGIFVGIMLLIFSPLLSLPLREVQIIIVTGFLVATLTLVIYPGFRRLIDSRIFGVSNSPNEIAEMFARRITTSLSFTDLSNLLLNDVLPTLMIRQSSLHFINNAAVFETLFAHNTPPDEKIDPDKLVTYLPKDETWGLLFRKTISTPFPGWVQLAIPLRIAGRLIGIWLLGSHDPDDEFSNTDLITLQAISSQLAIALSNIVLTSQLHAYYQSDIDREEMDRVEIARGLHDQVLNQLASLAMGISSDKPRSELLESYEKVKFNLRELIARMRPAVLDFGLGHAIHDLASQLMDSYPACRIIVQLSHQSSRYDSNIETHVFNIIQHVCENACRHSNAQEIVVSGVFEEDLINITIVDDGIGFNYQELNLSQLIEKRHFGLVGIRERAALIHANLVVDSEPGFGTRVYLRWEQKNND